MDISDRDAMKALFEKQNFQRVFNSAAQAGVRYSLENPHAYVDSNLVGFVNILEGCRQTKVEHLVYASSSSVYGANTNMPFSVPDNVDHQVSLYDTTYQQLVYASSPYTAHGADRTCHLHYSPVLYYVMSQLMCSMKEK